MARVDNVQDSLAFRFPEVAAEWDYEAAANQDASPWSVKAIAGREVAWTCGQCGNHWSARVSNRTKNGSGCEPCSRRRSSQEEALRDALAERFVLSSATLPRTDGVSRRRWQVDVFCSEQGFVVEFDGSYWHSERCNPGVTVRDAAKAEDLRSQGLVVIRVREAPLEPLHADDVVVPSGAGVDVVAAAVVDRLADLGVRPSGEPGAQVGPVDTVDPASPVDAESSSAA